MCYSFLNILRLSSSIYSSNKVHLHIEYLHRSITIGNNKRVTMLDSETDQNMLSLRFFNRKMLSVGRFRPFREKEIISQTGSDVI